MARKSELRRQQNEGAIEDYSRNMFAEGHNRTQTDPAAYEAPEYDHAAHVGTYEGAEEISPDRIGDRPLLDTEGNATLNPAAPTPQDTSHSRDGTDASGLYDETGGPIGGTEEEIDDLEASGTPVDRSPRAKR